MFKALEKYFLWHVKKIDSFYCHLSILANGGWFCTFFNFRSLLRRKNIFFKFEKSSGRFSAISKNFPYPRYFYSKHQNFYCYENGLIERGIKLGNDYLLSNINFKPSDVIVDIGANIGDLRIYFQNLEVYVEYIAVEPSPLEFSCLALNSPNCEIYNIGLWNEEGVMNFYLSSRNADSSFIEPVDFSEVISVPVRRLDSILNKRIKLLKIEAEGAEPEVLEGCEKILSKVEFISADLGFERGINNQSTLAPVTNFLLSRGFKLIEVGYPRVVAMFKNQSMPSQS
jgi:FkbM family methyltransferase